MHCAKHVVFIEGENQQQNVDSCTLLVEMKQSRIAASCPQLQLHQKINGIAAQSSNLELSKLQEQCCTVGFINLVFLVASLLSSSPACTHFITFRATDTVSPFLSDATLNPRRPNFRPPLTWLFVWLSLIMQFLIHGRTLKHYDSGDCALLVLACARVYVLL